MYIISETICKRREKTAMNTIECQKKGRVLIIDDQPGKTIHAT